MRQITSHTYHKYEEEEDYPLFAALLRFIVGFRDYGNIDDTHTRAIYYRCLPYDVTQIIRSFWYNHESSRELHALLRKALQNDSANFDKIYSQWARFWYLDHTKLKFGSQDEEKQKWLANNTPTYSQQQKDDVVEDWRTRPKPADWLNIDTHNQVYFYSSTSFFSKPLMCKKYKDMTLVKFVSNIYLISIKYTSRVKYKFSLCCSTSSRCMHTFF